jgi:hypothetical protein
MAPLEKCFSRSTCWTERRALFRCFQINPHLKVGGRVALRHLGINSEIRLTLMLDLKLGACDVQFDALAIGLDYSSGGGVR